MSINWQMDKANVVNSHNGLLLFSQKNEWSTDICHNMDEPQKHVEWKLSEARHNRPHTVWIIYTNIQNKQIHKAREISGF